MVSDKDYKFVEKEGEDISYVMLTGDNEWNGTVFQYGKLSVQVDEDTDTAQLSFNYNIIESPLDEDMLHEDEGFKNYIGELLQHIVTDALETGEYRIGSANTDTKESDQQ